MRAALVALAALALGAAAPAQAAPGEVVRVEHRDPTALPSRGPADALVTIELFFAPFTQSRSNAYRALEKLQASHPTKIRLIYRILRGSGVARYHYAALEAQAEGKYFEFMDELDSIDPRKLPSGGLTTAALIDLGKRIGMDGSLLAQAIANPPAGYDKVLDANDRRRRQRIRSNTLPNALFNGRLPANQLGNLGPSDLENQYVAAKDLAEDLIDRGADPHTLAAACDEATAVQPKDIVPLPGPPDEPVDMPPGSPPLASPPIRLAGLPSLGPADAATTVIVLCSPASANCRGTMQAARYAHETYPDSVRVVWGPYFDVGRDDAAELALLGDAALCAEKVGTSSEDGSVDASSGWRWVELVREEETNRHRRSSAEQVIEKTVERLGVDRAAFATCRARVAGTTIAFVEAARHAGVRATPSTIVGGRIYANISDPNALQQLVEAELSPGDCDGCLRLGAFAPAWRRTPR